MLRLLAISCLGKETTDCFNQSIVSVSFIDTVQKLSILELKDGKIKDINEFNVITENLIQHKQEIPSRQQKAAKKGSKRYLMFGQNHILVTF